MIVAGQRLPILIATRPVDFRCGHQALALMVQTELKLDPHSGARLDVVTAPVLLLVLAALAAVFAWRWFRMKRCGSRPMPGPRWLLLQS